MPMSEASLHDRRGPPVDASALPWAVPLALWVPWRVFPVVRRMRLAPLVAVYLLSVTGTFLLTFLDYSRIGAGAGFTLQSVLMDSTRNLAQYFATVYVLLTLCAASRHQRVRETLATGLKLTLTAQASAYLFWIVAWAIRLTSVASASWFVVFMTSLDLYTLGAIALAAAWMASHDGPVDVVNPLWPECIRCDYSLRGLPLAEAWLASRQVGTPVAVGESQATAECPECGLPIVDSLREHDLRVQRRTALERAWPRHPSLRMVLLGLLSRRLKPLGAWLVHGRRTSAAVLWLVAALICIPSICWHSGLMAGRASARDVLFSSVYYSYRTLFWTGVAGLLAGVWFSRRAQRNVIYLAQHALVPSLCAGICLLVAAQAAVPALLGVRRGAFDILSWYMQHFPDSVVHPVYLLLIPIVFGVEVALLRMVLRPVRSAQPDAERNESRTRESQGMR